MGFLTVFDRMAVSRRIRVGQIGLLFAVIVLACLGVIAAYWLQSWSSEYRDSARAQAEAANQIALNASAVGGYVLAAMGDTENGAQYKVAAESSLTAVREAVDSAKTLEAGDAEGAAAVGDLAGMVDRLEQGVTEVLALAAEDPEGASAAVYGQTIPLATQLREAAVLYADSEKAEETTRLDGISANSRKMLIAMLVVVAVAVLLGSVTTVRSPRAISRQLQAAAASISSSAAEMLAVSSQVAAGAAQTAASTNETTATVEEVNQTAQLAHEKAIQVAEDAQIVADSSELGRVKTEEGISGVERMQAQMDVVAETINRLSDQTQAVGEIIATVNDLAEQSNLLSVNASIEAAKAGDQGKGFTVVAQEVKNLAEQSKQAVSQVRTILSEIQKASSLAVQAAEQSREAIEAVRQQSVQSGGRIHLLSGIANSMAQSAAQISASSQQQLAGMEQISQAMESINLASNQSVSGTRQVEQEIRQMQELALRLRRLVEGARATG
jgi:hypothetical protein